MPSGRSTKQHRVGARGLVLLLVLGAVGCGAGDGRVTISYRPPVGTRLDYRTEVTSSATTDLPSCQAPRTQTDRTSLDATHLVLAPDEGDAVRVEVALTREGIGTRTFTMRFDRSAQLTEVEEVEGVPAAALGDLGLTELFPAAAGAPPEAPLAPGDRWTIADQVQLGDGEPTTLRGEGRLVELGVADGEATATVRSRTTLPVRTEAVSPSGSRRLAGEQASDVTAVYDLATGALRQAETATTGRFAVELGPPPGGTGDLCVGTLVLTIETRTRLVSG